MLARIRQIFRNDAYIPSTAVFPSIDSEQLSRTLRLEEAGRERGRRNQPPSSVTEFDHVETGIIDAIEELRRKGLDNYENNRRIYNERLARAGQASKEVNIAAGHARNSFNATAHQWQSAIVGARERLNETYRWRNRFREIHGLERPAVEFSGWANVLSTLVLFIVLEAVLNSYLFSKGNELGVVGGVLAAVIVSLVNVGISTLLGYLTRYIRHRQFLVKLLGLVALAVWFAFAGIINLTVAHFRDGLDAGVAWDAATQGAVARMTADPLGLVSAESWLLCLLGLLISALSFRKGWHSDDPYPGYGPVERQLKKARETYDHQLSDAISELEEKRDSAIGDLKEANDEVRDGINEAIDALFGQSSLNTHLTSFLGQCDLKLTHLLAIYRDANRAARSDPPPPSFDKSHSFAAFTPDAVDLDRRAAAEQEAAAVNETVMRTIAAIFDQFDAARTRFSGTDDVEMGGVKPDRKEAHVGAPVRRVPAFDHAARPTSGEAAVAASAANPSGATSPHDATPISLVAKRPERDDEASVQSGATA